MKQTYQARRNEREAERARWRRLDRILANARLGVFLVAVVLAWLALAEHRFTPLWTALPLLLFSGLVVWHHRVIDLGIRARRAVAYYDQALARLADDWAGKGATGDRFADPDHLYAADLDLFGRGSLFELLCTARTRAGGETLARWLLAPASPEVARARQEQVGELKDRLDLREEAAVLGDTVEDGLKPDQLRAWGAAPVEVPTPRLRLLAAAFPFASLAAMFLWLPAGVSLYIAQSLFALSRRKRSKATVKAAETCCDDLDVLQELLLLVERNKPAAQDPPSRMIGRLKRIYGRLESPRNVFFAPIAAALLWTTQVALAIDEWRRQHGEELARWIADAGEFEALCSLATYAAEHPEEPFPELVEQGARFEGEAVGHPLIADDECVRNDVSLHADFPLYLVSGSNMSGKSTLLRTVGTLTVLAYAGAPVRAKRLAVSPLAVGASLRVNDSIMEHKSRFFAEITRIREIVKQAKEKPTLFLLDEMLQGTNSHDRRIGAEAILKELKAAGAIGLATTHDLALTEIADATANVHFEDELIDGELRFDYALREGVVQRSNAIDLMRAVGLDV